MLAPKDILFEKTFANAREGFFVLDLDRLILLSNPAVTTLLGYSPDELQGRGFESLIFPEDRLRAIAELASVSTGKVDHTLHQSRCLTKYGAPLWCWVNSNSIHHQGAIVNNLVCVWSPEDVKAEQVLTTIMERIKELEIQLEHYPSGKMTTMSVHVGDNTGGGDKTGRDKVTNSQRAIYWIAGVLALIAIVLAWVAYYVSGSDHDQPPKIEQRLDALTNGAAD